MYSLVPAPGMRSTYRSPSTSTRWFTLVRPANRVTDAGSTVGQQRHPRQCSLERDHAHAVSHAPDARTPNSCDGHVANRVGASGQHQWQDQLQEGDDRVAAIRKPGGRSVRWSAPDQSRTDDRTALGCVVPRRPCAVGHRPAPAGNRACGSLRADSPGRCSTQAAGPVTTGFTSPRWVRRWWASTWPRRHWPSLAEKADDRGSRSSSSRPTRSQLERLGRTFDTVLDCGLFHTFDADERPRYVASLASVTEVGGTLYVLCFSDDGPDTGPHPISKDDLSAAFNPSTGWNDRRHRARAGAHEVPRRPRQRQPGWRPSRGSETRRLVR